MRVAYACDYLAYVRPYHGWIYWKAGRSSEAGENASLCRPQRRFLPVLYAGPAVRNSTTSTACAQMTHTHANYHRRFISKDWTATGFDIRVGTNGRMIAHTGPHHTPLDQYPAGLAKEDELHARFIAAMPAVFRAAQAVLEASTRPSESLMDEALDALETAVMEAAK